MNSRLSTTMSTVFSRTSPLPRIIALEGNIGAGKTTLFEALKRRLASDDGRVVFMEEPVHLWQSVADADGETVLSKFYRDPHKYAFSFQIMAYSTRLGMLRQLIRDHPDCEVIICERSLEADRNIFAKMLHDSGSMESVEFQIYELLYHETAHDFPLNAVVYVDSDPETCLSRIGQRAREGESAIPLDYLQQCRDYYDKWILSSEIPLLHIHSNDHATYLADDALDKGNQWVDQIVDFVFPSSEHEREHLHYAPAV